MGKMTSTLNKAVVSTGLEAGAIGRTVFSMGANLGGDSKAPQGDNEVQSNTNADIQKQVEANKIAVEKITAALNQKDEFAKLLAVKQSGILGGNQ